MQDDRISSPGDFYPILEKVKVMRDHIRAIVLVKYESLTERQCEKNALPNSSKWP